VANLDLTEAQIESLFAVPSESKAKRVSEFSAEELKHLFKELTSSKVGLDILWWLFDITHMWHTTFTGNALGNFKEGERNVGLAVLREALKARPTVFADMVSQHLVRQEAKNVRESRPGSGT